MKCVPLEKSNNHFQYVILLHFIFKNIKYNLINHLLVENLQKLDRGTLIEQSAILIQQLVNTHVLVLKVDFESIILNIIGLIFEQCSKA